MFRHLIWLLLALISLGADARAQEKPLKLSIRREWEGARSSAPLSLRVFSKWQRSELLEGHLHLQAFVDTLPISVWTSHEISLSDSEQVTWTMSPRPALSETSRYVLETQFLGNRPGLDIDLLDVEVPVRGRRVLVVGLIVEKGTSVPIGLTSEFSHNAFEERLSLHNYVTPEEASDFHVHMSRAEPKEFPDQPLRLLGLDALIVPHDMLDWLNSSRRESIRTWVKAGGSLLVLRTGQPTGAAEEWLQEMSLSPWPSAVRQQRHLPQNVSGHDVGLGQLLILDRGLDGASDAWMRTAAQLLRMRSDRSEAWIADRKLQIASQNQRRDYGFTSLEPRARLSLASEPGRFNLPEMLMPDSVRGMPFWLAALVLGMCLMCIGPLDYWLLGALGKRRWTWFLFPVLALGFTGWMAQIAADHNGKNDARHWLSIVDVTPEGEVLRTTRLELTYGASSKVVSHNVTNQWWCDLRQDDLRSLWEVDLGSSPDPAGRLEYLGAVPGKYTVSEPIRQWSTRMQRITTFGADPALAEYPLPQPDWDALRKSTGNSSPASVPASSPKVEAPKTLRGWARPGQSIEWIAAPPPAVADTRMQQMASILPNLLTTGAEKQPGVFYLLQELAPTAGPDCEDLVLSSREAGLVLQEVGPGQFLLTRCIFPTTE